MLSVTSTMVNDIYTFHRPYKSLVNPVSCSVNQNASFCVNQPQRLLLFLVLINVFVAFLMISMDILIGSETTEFWRVKTFYNSSV